MVDYLDIGKRIRKTRTAKGITQEKLAELISTGTTHVSHIETGNTIPSLKTFIAIVNALEVSPDELLCGNIDHSAYVFQNEISKITADCSPKEIRVIAETITSMKTSMRKVFGEPKSKRSGTEKKAPIPRGLLFLHFKDSFPAPAVL